MESNATKVVQAASGWIRSLFRRTDLRKLYEDLRRSERELRGVVNTIPAYVWTAWPDGSVDFINERLLEFVGLSLENMLGWNWESVLHSDDRAKFVTDWRMALKDGQSMESEIRVRRADGQHCWFFVRNVPLRDELGNVAKWYGTGIDIEDRKAAESLLAGEKRILESVTKGDPLSEVLNAICQLIEERASGVLASILLLDGDRLWHGAAPSLPKAYTDAIDGAPIGSLAGSYGTASYSAELWARYPHIDLPHSLLPVFWSEGEVIIEDISTDPVWAQYQHLALPHSLRACWSVPVVSSEGKVIAMLAMYYSEPRGPSPRDRQIIAQITHLAGAVIERKLTLEALRRSEAYLAEAEKLTHTGSCALRRGRIVYWSEENFRLWGLDPQKGLPDRDTLWQRIHSDDRDRCVETRVNALHSGKDYTNDYRIVLTDGTVRHHRSFSHPIFSPSGELIEIVSTVIDVTESKGVEQERQRLRELEMELAHISRVSMMGELAAALAHEIKQPITAAATNARTCLRWLQRVPPEIAEGRETASRIVADINRASDIINRVRSLYTKGKQQRDLVDVNELIEEIIALLRYEANRHAIPIRSQLAKNLPKVTADRVQLQQVLMNVMLNGIEAMHNVVGEITVKSERNTNDTLLISVRDTGVGLPSEQVDKVFDAFFTTKPQGTGMGLSISRSIIESHGGRLWAEANADRGATFYFTLPAAATAAEVSHAGA